MSPCGWVVEKCACGGAQCWNGLSPDARARAQDMAALIMWAATGRQYGLCEITVQPTGRRCNPEPLYQTYGVGSAHGLLSPVIDGGQWYNRPGYGGDGGSCCTDTGCEVELQGPVLKENVLAVTVDGVTLDEAAYVVFDGRLLTRVDGSCWPCCVNYSVQNPAGFTVTYLLGQDIPTGVQYAFERLACETAKACAGQACALPQRMTRLSRQGVDMEVEVVDRDITPGRLLTGIKEVDDVIVAVNPYGAAAPSAVYSPDMATPRRLT